MTTITGGPLSRFLQMVGFEYDLARSKIEALRHSNDPYGCPGTLVPLLAEELGVTYESRLGMAQNRQLLANLVTSYKSKGSITGVQSLITALTGWGSSVSFGPNLVNTGYSTPRSLPANGVTAAPMGMSFLLPGYPAPTWPAVWYENGYSAPALPYLPYITSYASAAPIPANIYFSTAAGTNWTNGAPYIKFSSATNPLTGAPDVQNYAIPVPTGTLALSSSILVWTQHLTVTYQFMLEFFGSNGNSLGLSAPADSHPYAGNANEFDQYSVANVLVPSNCVWVAQTLLVSGLGDIVPSVGGAAIILAAPNVVPGDTVTGIIDGGHATGNILIGTFDGGHAAGNIVTTTIDGGAATSTVDTGYEPPRELLINLMADRANLVANPSFENASSANWTGSNCALSVAAGRFYQDPQNFAASDYSMLVTATAAGDMSVASDLMPVDDITRWWSASAYVEPFFSTTPVTAGPTIETAVPGWGEPGWIRPGVGESGLLSETSNTTPPTGFSGQPGWGAPGFMEPGEPSSSTTTTISTTPGAPPRNVTVSINFYDISNTLIGTVNGSSMPEQSGNWVRPQACVQQSVSGTADTLYDGSDIYDDPAETYDDGGSSLAPTPSWTQPWVQHVAQASIVVTWSGCGAGEEHLIDCALFEKSDTVGMYFDGDYHDSLYTFVPDYQWAGGNPLRIGPSYFYRDFYAKFNRLDAVLSGVDDTNGIIQQVNVTTRGAPSVPAIGGATPGNGQITLLWNPPANDGGAPIIGYNVLMQTTAGVTLADAIIANGPNLATLCTYTVTGLQNDTEYYFKVQAVNQFGLTSLSGERNATTSSSALPMTGFQYFGPGYLVTVWMEPGLYNTPGDPTTGYQQISGALFGSGTGPMNAPGGPQGITWVRSEYIAPGRIVY